METVKDKVLKARLPVILLSCIVFTGCASINTLKRDSSVSANLTVDTPIDIVYQKAFDAAVDMQLLIANEDYHKKELLLKSGSYKTGIFRCSGNLIGVFLTEENPKQTRLQITERIVLGFQIFGCYDKAPAYVSQLLKKIRHTAANGNKK